MTFKSFEDLASHLGMPTVTEQREADRKAKELRSADPNAVTAAKNLRRVAHLPKPKAGPRVAR
jgi:hypothetical protein